MFFPLRDDNPTRRTPWVTYCLIALNVLVHLQVTRLTNAGAFWLPAWYGLVPARFFADPVGEAPTILSSMFMHGGWFHLASNMWFLHIFGDNLEDGLGRFRYLLFYLVCGLGAAFAQAGLSPHSSIPMIGASGAIAGVVGGYLILHPRAPVLSLNTFPPLWLFLGVFVVLPAWVIALIFVGQNLALAYESLEGYGEPGVAFLAHLGGFVSGFLLVRPMLGGRKIERRNWQGFGARTRRERSWPDQRRW
ncbi:MAG TPA: rhomboid family intramembrane serine protease [Polyangiaceae bacterium]|jgi:membrane associated rhomboid family serine protease|nr:rhomboid family intramembrane serine protease [Polyangiaceae bacterium]